jgi:hypothetical protein
MKMDQSTNKRFYKVISLFIKTLILIFSLAYIIYKLKNTTHQFDVFNTIEQINILLLIITFCLMFVNWGLEAIKWKLLIAPLERISFVKSLESVFSGVTVSIFMPNRIGEFVGRIFFLDKVDKIQATLKSFVGSFIQLSITLLIGFIALFVFGNEYLQITAFVNLDTVKIACIIFLVCLLTLIYLYKSKRLFSEKIQVYVDTVFNTPKRDITLVFLFSFIRYAVFLLQYYLILRALNIQIDFSICIILIAVTFLITSVVPSFAFTEIITRGAVATYVFACVTSSTNIVVLASFIIWVINLALPALLGSFFVWKLKFFNQEK